MPIYSSTSGWKKIQNIWARSGGTWRVVQAGWVFRSGAWRKFYQRLIELFIGTTNNNTFNQNLRTHYLNQTGDTSGFAVNVDFTLRGNLGANSTGAYALTTGSWPAGSVIRLIVPPITGGTGPNPANGIIAGMGGNADNSPCCDCNFCAPNSPRGGPAIRLDYPLTIVNNGIIGSGGQGGHGITMNRDNPTQYGGGGGAGISPGANSGGTGNVSAGTYRFGGSGSYPGGNLGTLNSSGGYGPGTASIVRQGNALTVQGNPPLGPLG